MIHHGRDFSGWFNVSRLNSFRWISFKLTLTTSGSLRDDLSSLHARFQLESGRILKSDSILGAHFIFVGWYVTVTDAGGVERTRRLARGMEGTLHIVAWVNV